jgi:hypothetical protein
MKWNYPSKNRQYFVKKSRYILSILLFTFSYTTTAQIPEGVPHPDQNTPIDFSSWSDIIIYIILPAVLIIGYIFLLYNRRRKRREGKKKELHNENDSGR